MKRSILLYVLISFLTSGVGQNLYFPPITTNQWDTVVLTELGWCADQLQPLYEFLEDHNTKAFIVLKDGKIAIEKYFGTFTQDSIWYWASAGKTLTAFIGRANITFFFCYICIAHSLPVFIWIGFPLCFWLHCASILSVISSQITL